MAAPCTVETFEVVCSKVIEVSLSLPPGESVIVTVCSTEEETAALLATVLDGDHTAASLLAKAIHQDPATVEANTDGLTVSLSPSELGIWIDPIGEELTAYHNPSQQSSSFMSELSLSLLCFFFFFKYFFKIL